MLLGPTEIFPGGMWGYGQVVGYPVSGHISSPFGPRQPILTPQGWTSDFHTGIDIPAPHGTPIFCPAPGEVAASYSDGAGAQTVVVRFDGASVSDNMLDGQVRGAMFIHMAGTMAYQGMKLQRGSIIGTVGSTGMSTGDHLHLSFLSHVISGPTWYAREFFVDPMTAPWTATIPNSEIYVPPPAIEAVLAGARSYAEQIKSYVDLGVPHAALSTMLSTLIGMMDET